MLCDYSYPDMVMWKTAGGIMAEFDIVFEGGGAKGSAFVGGLMVL